MDCSYLSFSCMRSVSPPPSVLVNTKLEHNPAGRTASLSFIWTAACGDDTLVGHSVPKINVYECMVKLSRRRLQWPRGLWHELSSLPRTLGSWVRIPLKAWMSVAFILCV
jgi:hypothetical protein